ncbi:MAG: hypothetical protein JNK82_04090 [Myxococcaceae bacterium]|nr:hypothetical protein [Myxococcaceae bacterium]
MTRALLLTTVLAAAGCAKRVPVSYEEPPPIFIEPGAPVFVKSDTKDHGAGNNVLQVMSSVGQGLVLNKWAAIEVVERAFADTLRRSNFTVGGAAQGAVLHLNLEPTSWSGETTGQGKQQRLVNGVLKVEAEFIDPAARPGSQPVLVRTLTGRGAISRGESSAMNDAAYACAHQLVQELSPKHVARRLPLDESEPLAQPAIEAAGAGRFDEALQHTIEARVKAPQSAPLVYNQAVLLLWKGNLDEGDALLTQAVQMSPNGDGYADAKLFSEAALKARAGWGGRTPPPPVR